MLRRLLPLTRRAAFSDVRRRIQEERNSRLNPSQNSLPVNAAAQLSAFRNICTIAHIDAGKTTLTERLLYGCGAIGDVGEVHDGTALMDFTEEERKRGITINSACITFMWKQVHINLIDTPGHADFNFEVERSLKILDGALVIIDAVKGVEAQTRMVWSQANKYNVARLIVINKMDKAGADYNRSIENVETTLGTTIFPAFIPVFFGDDFAGIIDIFGNQYYSWTQYPEGKQPKTIKDEYTVAEKYYRAQLVLADFPDQVQKDYFQALEKMVDILAKSDPGIFEQYLGAIEDNNTVSPAFLQKMAESVKQALIKFPVKYSASLPTSALKNKGIHTALDSIINYLPAPSALAAHVTQPLAFIFKRVIDPTHGILAFAKIICGRLAKGQNLLNTNTQMEYKAPKILRIRANEYAEMDEATSGDIVALSGLKDFSGGDNLILPNTLRTLEGLLVKGFESREPVYHVSVEFQNLQDREKFIEIIGSYVLEDPSIGFKFDKQTGQYIISGQGELHIETKLNRMLTEHNLRVNLGRVNVSFKEAAMGSHSASHTFTRKLKTGFKFLELDLQVESMVDGDGEGSNPPQVDIEIFHSSATAKKRFAEYLKVLEEIEEVKKASAAAASLNGETPVATKSTSTAKGKGAPKTADEKMIENLRYAKLNTISNPLDLVAANHNHDFGSDIIDSIYDLSMMDFGLLAELHRTLTELTVKGPLSYSPLVDTRIVVTGGRFNPKFIDNVSMRMAASEAFAMCLKPDFFHLLEPVVEVQITCKSDSVNEIISNAISQRKGRMGMIISAGIEETEFTVNIPLLTSVNYSSYLRSVTNGEVKMSMKNSGYVRAPQDRKAILLKGYV